MHWDRDVMATLLLATNVQLVADVLAPTGTMPPGKSCARLRRRAVST